ARFVRAVPEPSAREPELHWALGTLPPGVCREIVLVLAPTDANDVKNCARVQFEHGQCVTTRVVRSVPVPVTPSPAPLKPEPAPVKPEAAPLKPVPEAPKGKEPGPAPAPAPAAGEAKLQLAMTGP